MAKPFHILIIDDDSDDTDFLMAAFSDVIPDVRFTTVSNGQSALDLLLNGNDKNICPDVAFLDLHMPGKSGFHVLAELRAAARCEEFPVMVISTSTMASEAGKCMLAGATDYFSKPVSLQGYRPIVDATVAYLRSEEIAG